MAYGAALLRGWGLTVEIGAQVFDHHGHYLAGTDEARLADLNEALRDPGVRATVRQGMKWIYLDSYDELMTAITLYERREHLRCNRCDDNPQATVFIRKRLSNPYCSPTALQLHDRRFVIAISLRWTKILVTNGLVVP